MWWAFKAPRRDVGETARNTRLELGKTRGPGRRPCHCGRKAKRKVVYIPPPFPSRAENVLLSRLLLSSIFLSDCDFHLQLLDHHDPRGTARWPSGTSACLGGRHHSWTRSRRPLGHWSNLLRPLRRQEHKVSLSSTLGPKDYREERCSAHHLTRAFHPAAYPRTASVLGRRCRRTNPAALETWRSALTRGCGGRGANRDRWLVWGAKPSSMIGSQSNGREKPEAKGRRVWSLPESWRKRGFVEKPLIFPLIRRRRASHACEF